MSFLCSESSSSSHFRQSIWWSARPRWPGSHDLWPHHLSSPLILCVPATLAFLEALRTPANSYFRAFALVSLLPGFLLSQVFTWLLPQVCAQLHLRESTACPMDASTIHQFPSPPSQFHILHRNGYLLTFCVIQFSVYYLFLPSKR